jgi:hypothetical protein
MRFAKTVQEYATLFVALQWAYLVTTFGYEKWGFWGGALGFISSVPLLPFSPVTAWLHSDKQSIIWFYALLGIWIVAAAIQYLARPRIYDESGRRID